MKIRPTLEGYVSPKAAREIRRAFDDPFTPPAPVVTATPSSTQYVDPLSATATSNLTLTSSLQDIPGCSLTLDTAGHWIIHASVLFEADINTSKYYAKLSVGGTLQSNFIMLDGLTVYAIPLSSVWVVNATAGTLVKLRAYSAGETISGMVLKTHTILVAQWVSP